ncbi:MFS transporter [Kineococcus sp. SYSU DK003]|uniref:hypothetical protein n=1 Tax=Kineococcus sp. SYSU DK003 TaxID=3383124 RepID=UPI003D7D6D22
MSTVTPERPVWVILATHLVICTGQAFMWTALFTLALGSLPEKPYSHGSAALNTLQQLAGAASIAVLVSVLAIFSDPASAGASTGSTSLDGVSAAFTAASLIAVASIIGALFLPRRAKETAPTSAPASTSAAVEAREPR